MKPVWTRLSADIAKLGRHQGRRGGERSLHKGDGNGGSVVKKRTQV
ncbi:rCG47078 [Rattus norvegicus]|uniref:RCG47078 n=1 Tax=Rattus norvegicus TaxID=10116 RepID=A6KQE6_RAT|nr:rCG47078 [Rattus norvegicus]